MKINELLNGFTIYTSREEDAMLQRLQGPVFLESFNERDRFIIEGMIRKSLVIKIGNTNPRVIANEL
jgi:hypothetical protein